MFGFRKKPEKVDMQEARESKKRIDALRHKNQERWKERDRDPQVQMILDDMEQYSHDYYKNIIKHCDRIRSHLDLNGK